MVTETEFEYRSVCDIGQGSCHCHIFMVFWVIFGGTETGLADKN